MPDCDGLTIGKDFERYEVNGRQYVAIAAGAGLFVFALPE